MGVLPAYTFTEALYKGKLQVVSDPITDEGLRLIALKGAEDSLIEKFDQGLKDLKEDGTYGILLKKWNLAQ